MPIITVNPSDPAVSGVRAAIRQAVQAAKYEATDGELAAVYEQSEMAYVASLFWAQNVAAVKWQLYDLNGDVLTLPKAGEPVKRPLSLHEYMLIRFLSTPSLSRCLYNLEMSYRFFGRALAYRAYNDAHLLKEIRYINPLHYSPYINYATNELLGFRLSQIEPGMEQRITLLTPDEAFYYHGFSFRDYYDGVASGEVAFYDAFSGSDLSIFVRSVLLNYAVPVLAIQRTQDDQGNYWAYKETTPEGEVVAGDKAVLSDFLNSKFKGAENAGRVLVTEGRYEYNQLSSTILKDMDIGTLKTGLRENISLAFQINQEFFIPGQTTYAELQGKIRLWQDLQFSPHIDDYAQTLTEQIVNTYLPGYTVKPDRQAYLYESQEAKERALDAQLKSARIDLYEATRRTSNEVTPPEWMRGLYWVDGIGYMPESEVSTAWKYKLTVAQSVYWGEEIWKRPVPQPVDPNQVVPDNTGGQPVADAQTQAQAEGQALPAAFDPTKDTPNLFVALSLANNPDLMGLQQQVKSLNPSEECTWNEPNDFHVTLLTAPQVDESALRGFMDALKALPVPDLNLRVGSLGSFDAVGEHSMHFNIPLNSDLLDYQEAVYELAQEHGIPCSSFSNPESYAPHVTVGYSPNHMKRIPYRSKLKLQPKGVYANHGDKTLWESWQTDVQPPPVPPTKALPPRIPQPVYDELEILARKSNLKPFVPEHVSMAVALRAYHLLEVDMLMRGKDAKHNASARFAALKAYYQQLTHGTKSIQSTRLDYEGEVEDMLKAAVKGNVTKAAFTAVMFGAIEKYGYQAFQDGLTDGGATDAELSDDDLLKIGELTDSQRQYVQGIADAIYADDTVTLDEVTNKATMWFNKSIYPFYSAGIKSAASNGVFEWVLGTAEEHCASCKALAGQRRRYNSWARRILPKSDKLACKGFQCTCLLVPTDLPATRGNFPIWQVGIKHDHSHEDVTVTPFNYAIKALAGDEDVMDWFNPVQRRYELTVTKGVA